METQNSKGMLSEMEPEIEKQESQMNLGQRETRKRIGNKETDNRAKNMRYKFLLWQPTKKYAVQTFTLILIQDYRDLFKLWFLAIQVTLINPAYAKYKTRGLELDKQR